MNFREEAIAFQIQCRN